MTIYNPYLFHTHNKCTYIKNNLINLQNQQPNPNIDLASTESIWNESDLQTGGGHFWGQIFGSKCIKRPF
jgi:hypothetical protein